MPSSLAPSLPQSILQGRDPYGRLGGQDWYQRHARGDFTGLPDWVRAQYQQRNDGDGATPMWVLGGSPNNAVLHDRNGRVVSQVGYDGSWYGDGDGSIIDWDKVGYDEDLGLITDPTNTRHVMSAAHKNGRALVLAAIAAGGAYAAGAAGGMFGPMEGGYGMLAPGMEGQALLESSLLNQGILPGSAEWIAAGGGTFTGTPGYTPFEADYPGNQPWSPPGEGPPPYEPFENNYPGNDPWRPPSETPPTGSPGNQSNNPRLPNIPSTPTGGSSGGGGDSSVMQGWTADMAPRWNRLLDRGEMISQRPYVPYTGQRVAGLSDNEQFAIDNMRNYVTNPGDFLYGQGNLATQDLIAGKGMFGDPYANQRNQYSGENPYFRSQVSSAMRDIVDNYKEAIAPDINAQFALAGTFGGDAHQRALAKAQDALAKRLGDVESSMYGQQFDRSAGLEEQFLNRGSGAYQSERGRQMTGLDLAQRDQALTLDRYGRLQQMGQVQRGIDQAGRDFDYQQFAENRGWDRDQLGWLGGMFGTAQGNLRNQSTAQDNGGSWTNWLGALGAGIGLYNAFTR